jgi:hypothetical protein
VKYYIYISDAKVDMLFPQVPHEIKKKVATEWKMDLKLLSASRRVEVEGEDNQIARLEAVVDFIDKYGRVGSVEKPDEYISDTIEMKWAPYDYVGGVVFFSGRSADTIMGMGGSLHHLIGNVALPRQATNSVAMSLLRFIKEATATESEDVVIRNVRGHSDKIRALYDLWNVSNHMDAPLQRLEFVAKRLLYWPFEASGRLGEKCDLLLATPLYVAMVD